MELSQKRFSREVKGNSFQDCLTIIYCLNLEKLLQVAFSCIYCLRLSRLSR